MANREESKSLRKQLSRKSALFCISVRIRLGKISSILCLKWDFPGGLDSKASVCNAGDLGSIPGLGRTPGEGNGNPLQYYCLENPMNRGAW